MRYQKSVRAYVHEWHFSFQTRSALWRSKFDTDAQIWFIRPDIKITLRAHVDIGPDRTYIRRSEMSHDRIHDHRQNRKDGWVGWRVIFCEAGCEGHYIAKKEYKGREMLEELEGPQMCLTATGFLFGGVVCFHSKRYGFFWKCKDTKPWYLIIRIVPYFSSIRLLLTNNLAFKLLRVIRVPHEGLSMTSRTKDVYMVQGRFRPPIWRSCSNKHVSFS